MSKFVKQSNCALVIAFMGDGNFAILWRGEIHYWKGYRFVKCKRCHIMYKYLLTEVYFCQIQGDLRSTHFIGEVLARNILGSILSACPHLI